MVSEHRQAGGLVCEWARLSLSLDLSPNPLSAGALYRQKLAKVRKGKRTEIKETLVLLASLVKIWKKEGEVKSKS